MRTVTVLAATPALRHPWRAIVLAMVMLTGGLSTAALAQPPAAQAQPLAAQAQAQAQPLAAQAQPLAAQAAARSVDQCNGHGPGAEGATTALKCTVTVVNTITEKGTSSVTTVTRLCTLGPCATPNGTFTTRSNALVTTVQQCNNSDNDAAHSITCEVAITNNISASTPDAKPLTQAGTNQCVGSGASTEPRCTPFAARASAAAVTQCNGSANGGGGSVNCSVDPASRVSRAIPIRVNQCNGSGNPGGSSVSCQASVITKITASAPVAVASTPASTPTPTPTATTTTTRRATATPSASPTTERGALLVSSDSTEGPKSTGLLMLVAALVLAGALGALIYRRYAPATWPLVQRS